MSGDPTGMHEDRARRRKAALLTVAWGMCVPDGTPEDARDLDAIGRKALADLAGVPAPSDQTWDVVVEALEAAARVRDRMSKMHLRP